MGGSAEFIIENDCNSNLSVWVEPEAFPVLLLPDEKVVVRDEFKSVPVTVRAWKDDTGAPTISIWPGDGNTVVKKNDKNVLD